VSFEGVAKLEIVRGSLGASPMPVVIGDIPGTLYSFITGGRVSGNNGQGAAHYTLQHRFDSTAPGRAGWFETADRAVCAVAGKDPNVCRVNDVLQLVRGDGIFRNPEGFLTNHGTIDLTNFVPFVSPGSLTVDLGGRVCGAGL
jgi:hypothetical protein